MLKIFLIILSPLFFLLASNAYAEVNVKVNTNVSTSQESTSDVSNNIRIETNGKVTTYSSDKPENIEINATDNSSEIKVNGNVISPKPAQDNEATPTAKPTLSKEEKEEIKKNIIEVLKEKLSFFEKLLSFFQ